MLDTLALLVQLIGLILLVFGYRTSNRNLLLCAALCLWFGGGIPDFAAGFMDGVNQSA